MNDKKYFVRENTSINYSPHKNISNVQIDPSKIIVISPGSFSFKIGMAFAKKPIEIPSLIIKNSKKFKNENSSSNYYKNSNKTRDIHIQRVINTDIRVRQGLNSKSFKEVLSNEISSSYDETNSITLAQEKADDYIENKKFDFLFGDKASTFLNETDDLSDYEIINPFVNGMFNITKKTNIRLYLDMIEKFLLYCFEENLELRASDFSEYSISFVVPISFSKLEVFSFVDMFLDTLQFKAIFLHLEPVLACFGTAFSGACVIDVGGHTTKISCVQYGKIIKNSSYILPFGGENITELFSYYVTSEHSEFFSPLKDNKLEISKTSLRNVSEKIKKVACRFPESQRTTINYGTYIKTINRDINYIKMTLGDSYVLPPMGLFYPNIFDIKENDFNNEINKGIKIMFYYDKVFDNVMKGKNYGSVDIREKEKVELMIEEEYGNKIGLDLAIMKSILSMANIDECISIATSLLIVGGSAHLKGFNDEIEKKVKYLFKQINSKISQIEVLPRREGGNAALSEHCSWFGSAIVCKSEICSDIWISSKDWRNNKSLKLLRSHLPFDIDNDIRKYNDYK